MNSCIEFSQDYSAKFSPGKEEIKTFVFLAVDQNFLEHKVLEQNIECCDTAICQTWEPSLVLRDQM